MLREVNRNLIAGSMGAALLVAAVVCWPPDRSSAREASPGASHPSTPLVSVLGRTGAERPDALPFEHYRPLLQRNPFAPRLPKKVAPPAEAPEMPDIDIDEGNPETKKPEEKKPDTPKPPEPPDPLKDWVYNGTVAIGSDVYAVLENKTKKRSQYVKQGSVFEGATVENIAQGELALRLNGQPRTLAKSTSFNATPLNGGSGGTSGPGGAAQGGANPGGGPGNGKPGPAGPGGPAAPSPGGPTGAVIQRRAVSPPGGAAVATPTVTTAPLADPLPPAQGK